MGHDDVGAIIIISLLCGTGVFITAISLLYSYLTRTGRKQVEPGLKAELQSMRAEMENLRKQNNDVILSFDHTLQRLEQRMTHLEERALPRPADAGEAQPQLIGRQY